MFTWSASEMAPTATVGIPTSLRMRSANGVCHMRPYTGCWSATTWPELQSMMSAPAALNRRAMATASSPVLPPGNQSWHDRRTEIGRSCGHTARRAANTSSGQRARLSMLPPYSSVRWLVSGDRNDDSR